MAYLNQHRRAKAKIIGVMRHIIYVALRNTQKVLILNNYLSDDTKSATLVEE